MRGRVRPLNITMCIENFESNFFCFFDYFSLGIADTNTNTFATFLNSIYFGKLRFASFFKPDFETVFVCCKQYYYT